MKAKEQELKSLLTKQDFRNSREDRSVILEQRKLLAQLIARTENGIAVLSDFQDGVSYIYPGKLGASIGLMGEAIKSSSAFEEDIFRYILPEDLFERHILELRFFQFQKSLPIGERPNYNMLCEIRFNAPGNRIIPILHRTYYLENLPNGSIWLGLCLYTPFVGEHGGVIRNIVNNSTGETVLPEAFEKLDKQLLSPRETVVLDWLAKGKSSKQIAEIMHISVNTVYRHRQNILAALQVSNTAAAVEISLRLGLIH